MLFEKLEINEILKNNLKSLDYLKLTKIQEKVIPIFNDKKDILALAQTGTGKTAAFSLPILDQLLKSNKDLKENTPRVLILAPSRELCSQIGENIVEYSKNTKIKTIVLHGGEDFEKQRLKINEKKYEILISTPTRITDLAKNDLVNLKNIEFFILDEVDKILEENFNSNLKYLNKKFPKNKQCAFFSATMPYALEEVSKLILKNPIKIEVEEKINFDLISQNIFYIQKENKYKLLLELLKKNLIESTIIFTNSKKTTDELVRFLKNNDVFAEALHSGKSDIHRTKVLNNLKSRKNNILIATDLAARGLDIENISHIFNFDIPTSTQIYTHRIGRTARAGKRGICMSLCSSTERNFILRIEEELKTKLNILPNKYHSEYALKATGDSAKPKFNSKKTNFGKHNKVQKFPKRVFKNNLNN